MRFHSSSVSSLAALGALIRQSVTNTEFFDPSQPRDARGRFGRKGSTEVKTVASPAVKSGNFNVVQDKKVLRQAYRAWQGDLDRLASPKVSDLRFQIRQVEQKATSKRSEIAELEAPKDYRAKTLEQFRKTYGEDFETKERAAGRSPEESEQVLASLIERTQVADRKRIERARTELAAFEEQSQQLERTLQKTLEREATADPDVNAMSADRKEAVALIASSFEPVLSSRSAKVLGCTDDQGRLQALLNYRNESDHIHVELLASAPWNSIPNRPNAVRGAGRSAIVAAVELSVSSGHKGVLELSALPDAVPFYEKLGFTKQDDDDGLPTMRLSSKAASALLERSR